MIKIQNDSIVYPVPDKSLLARVEKSFEVKFPIDFINFLLNTNGAIPITKFFKGQFNTYVIDRFLCLVDNPRNHRSGMYDIKVVLTQLDERIVSDEDATGAELIPFVALFAGDFVCLDYRESKTNPSVCIWHNEDSGDFEPAIKKVAENVSDFINMLEE
ncbi:SMI1/KNR4 family protein [Priestia filamentosa]|uniref:SMI1/KNR4 family protein n=1 Tax=Priestia filamentosa TaxID=1402861 RepID=UPI0023491F36|nr:SMI1/KNR4 family protein [Priestia filamentosa]WCM14432.1 SMI1/KNR4 family protein [Priestia filamentosa]